MQPADRVEFVQALNGLAALKPGGKLTKEAIDLFWESMRGDWTLADFKAAATHLVKSNEFMPTPFHFEKLRKAGEPTADEAWDLVLSGAPLEPNSRVARAARTLGGQQHIRRVDVERELPHVRRNFIKAYDDLSAVDPVRDALPQVAVVGARRALRGPAPLAAALPRLERPTTDQPQEIPILAPLLPAPSRPSITVSAREKVAALARLHMDLTDDDIARISGQSIDLVREVRESAAELVP